MEKIRRDGGARGACSCLYELCGLTHEEETCVVGKSVDKAFKWNLLLSDGCIGDLKVRAKEEEHADGGHERPFGFALDVIGHRE